MTYGSGHDLQAWVERIPDLRNQIAAALCVDHGHARQQGGENCRTCSRRADIVIQVLEKWLPARDEIARVVHEVQCGCPIDDDALSAHREHQLQPIQYPHYADLVDAVLALFRAPGRVRGGAHPVIGQAAGPRGRRPAPGLGTTGEGR